jgi:hypothetical protein
VKTIDLYLEAFQFAVAKDDRMVECKPRWVSEFIEREKQCAKNFYYKEIRKSYQ